MNPALDTPRFFLNDLADVTGLPQTSLKTWLARGTISLGPFDREAEGSGTRRLLTLRTVYEFALAAKLIEVGLTPATAFQIACSFTRGEIQTAPGFALNRLNAEKDPRNPNTMLFDSGDTVLVIYQVRRQDPEPTSHVLAPFSSAIDRIDGDENCEQFVRLLFPSGNYATTIVHCNPIFRAVDDTLGMRRE